MNDDPLQPVACPECGEPMDVAFMGPDASMGLTRYEWECSDRSHPAVVRRWPTDMGTVTT